MSDKEKHIVQITAGFQTVANFEKAISRAAYDINTTHDYSLLQLSPEHFQVTVGFSSQGDAEKLMQKVETIDTALTVEMVRLKNNSVRLVA